MKNKKVSANIERSGFRIPRSVQQSIPIRRIYKDGIFEAGGMFSQTWKFTDINYSVAGPEAQEEMMKAYCAMIGSLPNDAITQITLNNRCLNRQEFQRAMMMRAAGDGMDDYRGEYNRMVLEKAESGNNLVQEKYITVSLARKNIEEARTFFTRVGNDFVAGFGRLSSSVTVLNADDRLRILHDFFRMDKNAAFSLNLKQLMRRGHDFRDLICPDSMRFRANHTEIGEGKFARVLFLKNYGSFIKDTALKALTEFPRNLMLSVDILPIPTEQAIKDVQNRILAVETDITRWQRRQNDNNNFSAQPPYDMTQMREEMTDFMTDLTMRDQRMMLGLITLVHVADSLKQLDADTDSLLSIGAGEKCEFATLGWQQEDGLNTVLPYGLQRIDTTRTLTTESIGIFLPFNTQEIRDTGGVYYGVNPISRNPIICNRKKLLNGNGFILGVSGSGKSFAAKEEIVSVALGTDDDIIVVDPEREVRHEVA